MINNTNLINTIKIQIDQQDSLLIERKFYEYNAGQDNIAFLMKDQDINWKVLQQYIDVVETRYVELEMLKDEMNKKYCPDCYKNQAYHYEFLFDTYEMKFTLME